MADIAHSVERKSVALEVRGSEPLIRPIPKDETKSMNKHKRIFSRLYAIYYLYNIYINGDNNDITDLFMDTLRIKEFDEKFSQDIIHYYEMHKNKIDEIRNHHQKRQDASVDKLLIIILNIAISEFLRDKNNYKIIISEYIKITLLLHSTGKNFIKSVLHNIFNHLQKIK